ncbi:hypothetical protein KHS38_16435 [Mucilaginibacter sp. Bleaf8]|uniref:hypothetical protein n=1 Tax=Mucilaginibacter sp. Bleaf8 TaxID=2834430 RepID=UPI001BD0A605|nr:hypothetical protein [Mucilaginibacter sp. Bleaf8]MBS7565996.1 hypothetical protein [Mucilaginibacter sp. Bleaf8]
MKKICFYLTLAVCTASFSSFTSPLNKAHVTVKKMVPEGYYVSTFQVLYGPYAGTYEAYASMDDHSQLIYVIGGSDGRLKFVTGSGSEGAGGSYSFYFNNDPAQETYGFIIN